MRRRSPCLCSACPFRVKLSSGRACDGQSTGGRLGTKKLLRWTLVKLNFNDGAEAARGANFPRESLRYFDLRQWRSRGNQFRRTDVARRRELLGSTRLVPSFFT